MDQWIPTPVEAVRGGGVQAYAPAEEPANTLLMTYQFLLNKFLEGVSPASKRLNLWTVQIWTDEVGAFPDTVVGDELTQDFEQELTRIRNRLAVQKSAKTSANFSSCMRSFRALYLRELKGGELPPKFADAIQVGLKRLGVSAHSLRETFGETVYHWAIGNTTPKRNSSLALVHQLEDYLELPHDSLVVRAHRKPVKIRDMAKDIPWRRYNSFVRNFKFRLKRELWPAELEAAFVELTAHKRKADHMLPSGQIVSLRARETWNTAATIDIRVESLTAFFGFLVLPKAKKPESAMTWEEKMSHGMGLPIESLRLTTLLNREYLFKYMLYCQMRTYDEAAFKYHEDLKKKEAIGDQPVQRTLSVAFGGFTVFVNNLVNKPHSFFCMHPAYAIEVGVPPDQWLAWLEQRHQEILMFATTVRGKVTPGKRSNKMVMQEMLRAANPLEVVHQLIERMRNSPPPSTAPMWLACHYRDIALFSILVFDPLRLKNLAGLRIGKTLKVKSPTDMALEISKAEFKNANFGYAEDKYRRLPPDVAADVAKWLEMRAIVLGDGVSDMLFIVVQKSSPDQVDEEDEDEVGLDAKDASFKLNRNSIYAILAKYTQAYLGLTFGVHAFRTLLATAVARAGTPAMVKSILNDSELVANTFYRDVHNADELDGLADIHEQLRAAAHRPKEAKP